MPRYEDLGNNRIRITFDKLDMGISKSALTGAEGQIAYGRDLDLYTSPGQIRPSRAAGWVSLASASRIYGVHRNSTNDNTKNFLIWGGDVSGFQSISASDTGEFLASTPVAVATATVSASVSASNTLATSGTPYLYMVNKPIEFISASTGISATDSSNARLYWGCWISAQSKSVISQISSNGTSYDQFAYTNGQGALSAAGGYKNLIGPVSYKEYFYYADNNVLYRNDGTAETVTLTLQPILVIKSITVINLDGNDWLALAVDYKNGSSNSLVYIYDGVSTFLRQIIDTGSPGVQVVRQLKNSLVTIHSDNPYLALGTNDTQDNYIRIKTWNGGGKFEEVYPLFLKAGDTRKPYFVRDSAAIVLNDALLFGIDGGNSVVSDGDTAAIYSFRLPNILNEEYLVNVSGSTIEQIDFKNLFTTRNFIYAFFVNNTTVAKTFVSNEGGNYSTNGLIRTLPFRFDIRHPAVIKLIEGQVKAAPASSTTLTVKHYPNQGTAKTIGTIATLNQRTFRFTNENGAEFPISDIDQIEFSIPGTSTTNRAELIMPFIIEAEIRKSN